MTTATTPSKSSPSKRQGDLQAYLNNVAGQLQIAGRSDLVMNLKDAVEARRESTATLVVVGETSRGKSSFVNALLGEPDLSPVGLDTTTGCSILLHKAVARQARVRMYETGEIKDIPLGDVEDWATVDGNPDNERRVHAVLVGVDNPLLEQISIIDTPGVGGLDAGHGVLAAEAAASADALILVVDASAPISLPELGFLEEVASRVDNVTLVLTKIDDYDEWRAMAEEDRRLVAARNPRLTDIPFFAVSSMLAMNSEDRKESGIQEVESHLLTHIAKRTDSLRFANILRVADSCLVEVCRQLDAQRAVLAAGGEILAALEEERSRLNEVGAEGKKLMRDLEDGFRRLGLDRADALNRGMRDLRTRYDDRAGTVRGAELSALPSELISDVTALADRLTKDARDRLTDLSEELIRQVDTSIPELASFELLDTKKLADAVSLDTPRKRATNRVERLSTLISFSSGRSIGSLVATLPLVALGGTPFIIAGLGLGAVFAFHMHKGRNDVTRQNEFRTWMREQLAEAERQLNNDFSRAMIDVGHELRTALGERIDTRRAEVGQAIRECEQSMAREDTKRKRESEAIEQRLGDLRALRKHGSDIRSDLLGLGSSTVGRP
jgi:predicted GTPase